MADRPVHSQSEPPFAICHEASVTGHERENKPEGFPKNRDVGLLLNSLDSFGRFDVPIVFFVSRFIAAISFETAPGSEQVSPSFSTSASRMEHSTG